MSTASDCGAAAKRLTVVTTAFRASRHLEAFCAGVEALQGLDEIELCLVMNEPDEEEARIVADHAARLPDLYRIIVVERESIGASLNRGLMSATTQYCAFLDVDDARVSDSFVRQMAVLDADPHADFTYGDYTIVPAQGQTEGRLIEAPEFDSLEFTRSCLASPTQLMRRSLIDRIGGFDEQFGSGGDFEFQIRAALSCRFVKTPGLMVYYTRNPNSAGASISPLQPLERTVSELRYGLYDKTIGYGGYRYVDEARRYRLQRVLMGGTWHDIREFVPDYDALLDRRAEGLRRLETNLVRWKRREIVRGPLVRASRAVLATLRRLRRSLRGARSEVRTP
jgi:glycosyltransferase involved in cell wall biosynthesis